MLNKFGFALSLCAAGWLCSALPAQGPTYASPEAAAASPAFALQGEYLQGSAGNAARALQVVALADDEFDVTILEGGLPGAGWDRSPPRKQTLDSQQLVEFVDSGEYKKVERQSPTLGQVAPTGAVVLFDGTRETLEQRWEQGAQMTEEGLLIQNATTRDQFESYTLHLEFRTPFMPEARGQGRGNSGVYHQGRFETQILDSFGLEGKMNESGGLYSIKDPDLNMCLPPLSWQTYDVDFTAGTFDEQGQPSREPQITVRFNGVTVQQDIALPHTTPAAPRGELGPTGPLFLQDHGNPVRFRNIWIKPRDMAREGRRPRLPAFERLYGRNQASSLGGHLLVSELGCTQCHTATQDFTATRQAPILEGVGQRLRANYLLDYLQDPHGVKPGTTMPDVLAQLSAPEKERAASALASFLISTTGSSVERQGDPRAVGRGESLFHSVGCTACHASQRQPGLESTSVPLGDLADKYVLDGLAKFLAEPHAIRPSGRMPSFGLTPEQANDLATYLLRDAVVGQGVLNVRGEFFLGSWDTLPDFSTLKPYLETDCFDFDITASGRDSDFAARFNTTIAIPTAGKYRFSIGSDDGSRLFVNDQLVADNDGVHPMQFVTGEVELAAGWHAVRVEYFEKGGEEVLQVDIEGDAMLRTSLGAIATLDPEAVADEGEQESKFQVDPSLVADGRKLFQSAGCAACHQLQIGGERLLATSSNKAFADLDATRGCMAEQATGTAPNYDLSDPQRAAIHAWINASYGNQPAGSGSAIVWDDATQLHQRMAALNCYACHVRAGVGGPELARDGQFQTTMKEMGDEGRLPPPLNGAGDKLNRKYLESILAEGVNERPYMLVNMPGFGAANAADLTQWIVKLDEQNSPPPPRPTVPEDKLKSDGRLLVGDKGLSCVKCHTFGGEGAPGIQAIDLQRMSTRLREDWFHRYLVSPTTYRPGTRMPASFPDGKSVLPDLYDGVPGMQIHAMWDYLSDGPNARQPIGVGQELIELVPSQRPVIYRNFIEGLTPRAIAVGYPENVHVAWDANRMALALLWKGAFIDASRHWVGRGPGNQEPLGDEVIQFETFAPLAKLASPTAAWPEPQASEFKFLGYRFNGQGQPTFRYRWQKIEIEDTPLPRVGDQAGSGLLRRLTLTGDLQSVVFRAATGRSIVATADGAYRIDSRYAVRVPGAVMRVVGGRQELIVPIDGTLKSVTIEQEINW